MAISGYCHSEVIQVAAYCSDEVVKRYDSSEICMFTKTTLLIKLRIGRDDSGRIKLSSLCI